MPMFDRRPNLASLVVPSPGSVSIEDIKTPLPHTPLIYTSLAAAPMVMTPDTPCFTIPSIEATLASADQKTPVWSESLDEVILSYLSHPPRPLHNAYPPDSLPPPDAIEEICLQLLLHPQWPASHGIVPTRARTLELARKRVTEYHQGPKREYVPLMPAATGRAGSSSSMGMSQALGKRSLRPKLSVGGAGPGSLSMSRQADSMDSLYGDAEAGTFSEALRWVKPDVVGCSLTCRLSGTLQDTAASGTAHELSSVGALSSPLDFTFTFNPPQPAASSALSAPGAGSTPFGHGMRPPRPTSLLQRGRSFTGQDLANIPCTIDEASHHMAEDEVEELETLDHAKVPDQAFREASTGIDRDVIREPSSPVSSFTNSPPSSINSSVEDEEMPVLPPLPPSMASIPTGATATTTTTLIKNFGNLDVEPEPFTPLNPTFFSIQTPLNPQAALSPMSGSTGAATPAITLTIESPADTPRLGDIRADGAVDGDTKMASPTSTAQAFAKLSLASRMRNPPPAPIARRARPAAPSSTGLSRSLSDGMVPPRASAQGFNISRLAKAESNDALDRGHSLARPMIKRQKSNMPELSVFVPRPGGRNWADELRSPFEHKPAGGVAPVGL